MPWPTPNKCIRWFNKDGAFAPTAEEDSRGIPTLYGEIGVNHTRSAFGSLGGEEIASVHRKRGQN